jgi:beta-aspartyl-peptidase (threonine type)
MTASRPTALVLHGGAGVIERADLSADTERGIREALAQARDAGEAVLRSGGSALDAVQATVVALEESPHFNAGKGAVFDADGKHELDASIMDGATLRAGAVAGVSRIRNPILAARAVMEHSPHVLLAGKGAEVFAFRNGIPLVNARYFHTAARLDALKKNLKHHHGTVGAVALDRGGNLAAATSTGGFTGKLPGRVGDSPVIGAGTWADNATCAVSGTGHGELFLRTALAHDVAARIKYGNQSLNRAATAALRAVARLGGDGGLVAVDRRGNVAMPFNSAAMLRACVGRDGRAKIGA